MTFGLNVVQASDQVITNDGFFPDVKVADFQNVFHEVNDVDFEKVISTLRLAMLTVNKKLLSLKGSINELTLIESDNDKLGDVSGLELQYLDAVFGTAKTKLLPLIINVVTREKAQDLEANLDALKREYSSQANQAIRYLLGLNTATVEMI